MTFYDDKIVVVDCTSRDHDWQGDNEIKKTYEAALGSILCRSVDVVMMSPHQAGEELVDHNGPAETPALIIVHEPSEEHDFGTTENGLVAIRYFIREYGRKGLYGDKIPPMTAPFFVVTPRELSLMDRLTHFRFAEELRKKARGLFEPGASMHMSGAQLPVRRTPLVTKEDAGCHI